MLSETPALAVLSQDLQYQHQKYIFIVV